jgi:DNA-directed RNA polymerase specialized sigma24 family protein
VKRDAFVLEEAPLSSDLEWMLGSGQASPEMIAEALVTEFYAPVYRLLRAEGLALETVEALTLAALSRALEGGAHFAGQSSIRAWLARLAVSVLPRRVVRVAPPDPEDAFLSAWLAQEPRTRRVLFLQLDWGLTPAETAVALKLKPGRVTALASMGRDALEGFTAWQAAGVGAAGWEETVDRLLGERLATAFPLPPEPGAPAELAAEVLERARPSGKLRRRPFERREVAALLVLIAAALVLGWGGYQLMQEEVPPPPETEAAASTAAPPFEGRSLTYVVREGDTLASIAAALQIDPDTLRALNELGTEVNLAPGERLQVVAAPPLTGTLTAEANPLPPPLTRAATASEVQQRLALSPDLWRSLYFDAQLITPGPPNYVGPVGAARLQGWIEPKLRVLELYGGLDGKPLLAALQTNGQGYLLDLTTEELRLLPWRGEVLQRDLAAMLRPDAAPWIERDDAFQVLDEAQVAGRAVIVADWYDESERRVWRVWIDARLGIILRLAHFAGEGEQFDREIIVTSLMVDRAFPAEVFDPLRPWTGFAADWRAPLDDADTAPAAQPLALPAAPRPELPLSPTLDGYDPAAAALVFQFSARFQDQLGQRAPEDLPFDLFADGMYAGEITFAFPWNLHCARARRGSRLAYAVSDPYELARGSAVYWFNLREPGQRYVIAPEVWPQAFAFTPDGAWLLIVGETPRDGYGLYMAAVGSGDWHFVMDFARLERLVWDDERSWFWVVARDRTDERRTWALVNMGSRWREVDLTGGSAPSGRDLLEWGGEMGGMAACATVDE